MNIVLAPYSRPLRNGKENPKNYPHWAELVRRLRYAEHTLIQIGLEGEPDIGAHKHHKGLPLKDIGNLIVAADTWISIDSWLQHMAHHLGKPGIVLYGQSDPLIFGYPENTNLLKDRKYLRPRQFELWESAEYTEDAFVDAETVILALTDIAAK